MPDSDREKLESAKNAAMDLLNKAGANEVDIRTGGVELRAKRDGAARMVTVFVGK